MRNSTATNLTRIGTLFVPTGKSNLLHVSPEEGLAPGTSVYGVYESLEKILQKPAGKNGKQYEKLTTAISSCPELTGQEVHILGELLTENYWQLFLESNTGMLPVIKIQTEQSGISSVEELLSLGDTLDAQANPIKSLKSKLAVNPSLSTSNLSKEKVSFATWEDQEEEARTKANTTPEKKQVGFRITLPWIIALGTLLALAGALIGYSL